MTRLFKTAWEEVVRPFFLRPRRVQVAALCLRKGAEGDEILLITSRDTGRWVLPKGWPIAGLDGGGAAAREAWEEAGVSAGSIGRLPLGTYFYDKRLDSGAVQPVETHLYRVDVQAISDDYPEAGQRQRRWVRPSEAATMVDEPSLQMLLRRL